MFFSRTVLGKHEKVLIQKVPETWTGQQLLVELSDLIQSAEGCKKEGITGVQLADGSTLQFTTLEEMSVIYKFLGIPYKYVDIIIKDTEEKE